MLDTSAFAKATADKGIWEIVHAPNLKNKIGAGYPCTIRRSVYAHSELEKLWRESEAIQREKSIKKAQTIYVHAHTLLVIVANPLFHSKLKNSTLKATKYLGR